MPFLNAPPFDPFELHVSIRAEILIVFVRPPISLRSANHSIATANRCIAHKSRLRRDASFSSISIYSFLISLAFPFSISWNNLSSRFRSAQTNTIILNWYSVSIWVIRWLFGAWTGVSSRIIPPKILLYNLHDFISYANRWLSLISSSQSICSAN